jgi:hypothetical protein
MKLSIGTESFKLYAAGYFKNFTKEEVLRDTILVASDGEKKRVHRLIISAASEVLRQELEAGKNVVHAKVE